MIEPHFVEEAVLRVQNIELPSFAAAKGVFQIPALENRMSFGLRQVDANLFGSIWRHVKSETQKGTIAIECVRR